MHLRRRILFFFRTAWEKYLEFHKRAPFKHQSIALIGIFAYPIYYAMWTFVLPQPYESVTFRIVGMALCVGVWLGPWWPLAFRRFYLPYTYLALMICLPAFFTFMLLMNDANVVWLMSMMASLLFVVLLYDALNAVIVSIVGSLIGIGLFASVREHASLPDAYLACIPVYAFEVAAVIFLAVSGRTIGREKLQAASILASNIAHEMRTPLLGIRLDSERLQKDTVKLVEGTKWAIDHGWKPRDIDVRSVDGFKKALARIEEHAVAANLVIEMLLVNATPGRVGSKEFAVCSFDAVINTALDRFHFRPGERARIRITGDTSRTFWGSDLLMVHVLFNLLKNGLNAIEAKGEGSIVMAVKQTGYGSEFTVHDDGEGIPRELLDYIFMPFVTGGRRMQGTGIGLSFCKAVIEGFGGTITCQSEANIGTTFLIALPEPGTGANDAPVASVDGGI